MTKELNLIDFLMQGFSPSPKVPKAFKRKPPGRRGLDRSYQVPEAPKGQVWLPLGRDQAGVVHNCLIDTVDLPKVAGFSWFWHPLNGALAHVNHQNQHLVPPLRRTGKIPKVVSMHRRIMNEPRHQVIRLDGDNCNNTRRNLSVTRNRASDHLTQAPTQTVVPLNRTPTPCVEITVKYPSGQTVSACIPSEGLEIIEVILSQLPPTDAMSVFDDVTFRLFRV